MKKASLLLLVSILCLTGCATRTRVVEAPNSQVIDQAALARQAAFNRPTSWILTEWITSEGAQAYIPERGNTPINLQFYPSSHDLRSSEGTVSGFSGCHHIQGNYVETENAIVIGTLVSTLLNPKQNCKSLILKMEEAFLQRISNTALYKAIQPSHQGSIMTLTSKYGNKWTFAENASVAPLVPRKHGVPLNALSE